MTLPTMNSTDRTDYLPTFPTVEAERHHRKVRLAGAYRMLARFGLDDGAAGHITVRDPEHPECFWVNHLGQNFAFVTPDDLILVNKAGDIVEGHGALNEAAFAIHSQLHQARPDVVSAVHSHSTYGKAWSAFGRLLQPLTQDACTFYDDHAVFEEYEGVVYSLAGGARIANALGQRKAIILLNHGLITVGHSVDEATYWFVSMERSCQVQMLAASTREEPRCIDHETAALTASQVGTHWVGWLGFQVLWQEMIAGDPDIARW